MLGFANAFATTDKLLTLEKQLNEAETNFEIAKANYLLALYFSDQEPLRAKPYIVNCMKAISLTDSTRHLAKAYKLAGYIHYQLNNYKQAGKAYLYGAKYFEQVQDRLNASRCYIDFAVQALNANDLATGEAYLQRALKASMPDLGNHDLGLAYLLMGDIYNDKGNYEAALKAYNEAGVLLRNNFEVKFGISDALLDLGQYEEAAIKLGQLKEEVGTEDPYKTLAVAVEYLKLYEGQGAYAQVLQEVSFLKPRLQPYKRLYAITLYRQWAALSQANNTANALNVARELVQHCQQHNLNNQLLNFLPALATFATNQKQHKLAVGWFKELTRLRQTLVFERMEQETQVRIELALATQEFDIEMQEANAAQGLDNTFSTALLLQISVGMGGLIVLLLLLYIWPMYKKHRQFNVELKALYTDQERDLTNEQIALRVRIIYRNVYGKLLVDNFREDEGGEEEDEE